MYGQQHLDGQARGRARSALGGPSVTPRIDSYERWNQLPMAARVPVGYPSQVSMPQGPQFS
jgi:hypothetical protein